MSDSGVHSTVNIYATDQRRIRAVFFLAGMKTDKRGFCCCGIYSKYKSVIQNHAPISRGILAAIHLKLCIQELFAVGRR